MVVVSPQSIPSLGRGVRLRHDNREDQWVMLAPEKTFELDEIAAAVMQLVDGNKNVADIAGELSAAYGAEYDQVFGDVCELFAEFADKRVLVL